jgi:glycosyltransferase involved in cell wall biosynthesis
VNHAPETGGFDTDPTARLSIASALRRVSVVIPAFNEAASISGVLAAIPREIEDVIVVDGVSTDETARIARAADERVRIVARTRSGKGNALACGFAAAREEYVVALDADGSADPRDIPAMLAPLAAGDAEFVKGHRLLDDYAGPLLRRVGASALTTVFNRHFDTAFPDVCCGFIAFRSDRQGAFGLDPHARGGSKPMDGFEIDTALLGLSLVNGLAVRQQPVRYYPRVAGRTKTRPARDGQRVVSTILGFA